MADEGDLCEAIGGDFCEVDNGKLATVYSQMPQLPPNFSKASHTAKMFVFLNPSLLKVKSSKLSPASL